MGKKQEIQDERIQKMNRILQAGNKSKSTITNYESTMKNFLNYFTNRDIEELNEDDILEYLTEKHLKPKHSPNTYNMNLYAIEYFYKVNYNKTFNTVLLPHAIIRKSFPVPISQETFDIIFHHEKNLEHKCWLLLAYKSGLRVSEVATLKIENVLSKEHKLKILGKRQKERYTVLPNITVQYLRLYYKEAFITTKPKTGYLFKGCNNSEHINCKSISNYFRDLINNTNLNQNVTFHSLRHRICNKLYQKWWKSFRAKVYARTFFHEYNQSLCSYGNGF